MRTRCLLVDDSPLIVRMLGTFLAKNGFDVITAADGFEAVEKTFNTFPDIILLDVMMPRMNGYQVCRLLKNEDHVRDTPVIMFTSKDKEIERYCGLETGADAYVTKDIAYDSLMDLIQKQLAQKRIQRPVPKEERAPVTMADVIIKTNDLLDKKLHGLTILQRIVTLARDIRAYRDIVEKVLGIVCEITNSDLAAFCAAGSETIQLFIKSASSPHPEDLRQLEGVCRAQVRGKGGSPPEGIDCTVLSESEQVAAQCLSEPGSICTFDTGSHPRPGRWRGFILQGKPVNRAGYDRALMELVLEQALVVLENAYFYDEIRLRSITDQLTGLFNRRHFYQQLQEEYQRQKRYRGTGFALLLLDIDHFKKINDTYGHMVGDDVLRGLARVLTATIRDTDVAARFGGEEFIVLLPETGPEGGLCLAERLRRSVEEHRFGALEQRIPVTVSVGISHFEGTSDRQLDEIVTTADEALYRAKEGGRNRVCIHGRN